MNSILQNSIKMFDYLLPPVKLSFEPKEFSYAKLILESQEVEDCEFLFESESKDKLIERALENNMMINELTTMSNKKIIIHIKLNCNDVFSESFLVPNYMTLHYENLVCRYITLTFKFTEKELSKFDENDVMLSFLEFRKKQGNHYKKELTKNGLKNVNKTQKSGKNIHSEDFLNEALESLIDIKFDELVTKDCMVMPVQFSNDKEKINLDFQIDEYKHEIALKSAMFRDYDGVYHCEELCFIDKLCREMKIERIGQAVNIHYEMDSFMLNSRGPVSLLKIKYINNVYPRKIEEFSLSGPAYWMFPLHGVEGETEKSFTSLLPDDKSEINHVMNYLMHNMGVGFLNDILNIDVLKDFTKEDYELLKINFNEVEEAEDLFRELKDKMELFYDSFDLFGKNILCDEHAIYLKKNIL